MGISYSAFMGYGVSGDSEDLPLALAEVIDQDGDGLWDESPIREWLESTGLDRIGYHLGGDFTGGSGLYWVFYIKGTEDHFRDLWEFDGMYEFDEPEIGGIEAVQMVNLCDLLELHYDNIKWKFLFTVC